MFETDRVPSGWSDRMNAMDEIWVPTKFQHQVFVDGGVRAESVHVLPEAVDVHFFDPATVDTPYDLASEITGERTITESTTVFLSVFKWEERKGWKVLLRAYFAAFAASDDVVLVILTSAYHASSQSAADFMAIIEAFAQTEFDKPLRELPLVYVVPPQLPQHQLPALYKAATAFVLPSRGEGWGRPHVEAMAMGLPIISTFWSGTTEYMTEENSYPLRIDGLVEVRTDTMRLRVEDISSG
jgi:glycosyltransferase involved in cell wall biosynthesis